MLELDIVLLASMAAYTCGVDVMATERPGTTRSG